MTDKYSDWDAAYVLGSLSPADRREYEQHLATCESCSASVAELAGMPGLLSLVPAADAAALLIPAAPDPVPQTLLPRMVRSARRRSRRVRGLVAGGIVAAAAAAAAIVLVVPAVVPHPVPTASSSPIAQVVDLRQVVPNPLTASIRLVSVGWGTRIEMNCHYGAPPDSMPPHGYTEGASLGYSMYVTDATGHSTEIATWWATPNSTAEPSGTTSLAVSQIASIDVRATDGTVLLSGTP